MRFPKSHTKLLLCLMLSCFVVGWTQAQSVTAKRDAEALSLAFEVSESQFEAGDFAGGQATLSNTNMATTDTLLWYLETAGKLTQVASHFRCHYNYALANSIASHAVALLQGTKGTKTEGSALIRHQAEIYEQIAYIYEEFLNDLVKAKVNYQHALSVNPDSSRATDGLARVAELENSIKRNGGGK